MVRVTDRPLELELLLALLILCVSTIWGQQNNVPDKKTLPSVKIQGVVRTVRPGYMEISTDRMQVVFPKLPADSKAPLRLFDENSLKSARQVLAFDQRTRISVVATTSPEALKPGQGVRFRAKVDKNGAIVGALDNIDLFVPDANFQPQFDVTTAFSGFFEDRPGDQAPLQAEGIVVSYARGQLVMVFDNNRRVTATVSPSAQVNVSNGDYALAKDGNPVTVTGHLLKPGQVLAESVSVTLAHLPAPKPPAPEVEAPATPATEKQE